MSAVDDLIKDAESSLVKVLTARVVGSIVVAGSFWAGPLGFILGLVIAWLARRGDWLTYHLGNGWLNSANADVYQKTGEALDTLPPTATQEQINAAKKAKSDAFDVLMGVRSV